MEKNEKKPSRASHKRRSGNSKKRKIKRPRFTERHRAQNERVAKMPG